MKLAPGPCAVLANVGMVQVASAMRLAQTQAASSSRARLVGRLSIAAPPKAACVALPLRVTCLVAWHRAALWGPNPPAFKLRLHAARPAQLPAARHPTRRPLPHPRPRPRCRLRLALGRHPWTSPTCPSLVNMSRCATCMRPVDGLEGRVLEGTFPAEPGTRDPSPSSSPQWVAGLSHARGMLALAGECHAAMCIFEPS